MTDLRKIGSSDLEVFPLNLGGNVFGWTADRDQSFAVLDAYRAAGGNFVDTSDSYPHWVPGNRGGESEAMIGEWLETRGIRAEFVVATKVGSHPEYKGLAPGNIKRAAEASLERLRTDYIDLYYTHYDDEAVPVEEIMGALDELVRAGKVRAIGASNISIERLQEELEFSGREGTAPYVALQPHYNLVSRETYEGERRRLAEQYGLGVMPYYALASGFLTGKYRPETVQKVQSARAANAARYLESERGSRGSRGPRRSCSGARRRAADGGARMAGSAADGGCTDRERADSGTGSRVGRHGVSSSERGGTRNAERGFRVTQHARIPRVSAW